MEVITIKDNEKFLRRISKPVKKGDKNLNNDIKILENYCMENEVMAMAAVQLGILKRLIYLKITNLDLINKINNHEITKEEENKYNEKKILINPVILKEEGITDYWEACASCLDNFGHVHRPYKITLRYETLDGVVNTEEFSGFEATVLSHEMDHLDGILHIDKAYELKIMPREERAKYRKKHNYHIIKKTGDFKTLLNIYEK